MDDSPSIDSGGFLPPSEWHESLAGVKFDLYDDRWHLTSKRSINVAPLRAVIRSDTLKNGVIRTLAHQAGNLSHRYCEQFVLFLRHFFEHAGNQIMGDDIPETTVVSYRGFCNRRDGHDDEFQRGIRPFLTKWHALGHLGVSRELVERMRNWRLTGSERGIAVNRLDVNDGPLMPNEHQSFAALALTAFEQQRISLSDYTTYRLLDVTGRRPAQLSQLKIKDMDDSRLEDPEPGRPQKRILLLHVPRIKGRRKWRQHFRSVPLSTELWNLLAKHAQNVQSRFDELLKKLALELQSTDLAFLHRELPLFPG